ncbi:2982_t:CDS:2, partial [Funneliformis caledonium]
HLDKNSILIFDVAKNVKIRRSTNSKTNKVTIYNIKDRGFYIDTPGLDASHENMNDEKTAAKTSYKRQAKFIETLMKYYTGNAAGPRDAAREMATSLSRTGEFKILLFKSLPSNSVYRRLQFSSDQLNEFGVFKESEPDRIVARYESLMKGHIERPIFLEIRRVKCLKCSEETDLRFASPKCHLDSESFHPDTELVHQGNVIDIHPASHFQKHSDLYVGAITRKVSDHSPEAWTTRVFTFGELNLKDQNTYLDTGSAAIRKLLMQMDASKFIVVVKKIFHLPDA